MLINKKNLHVFKGALNEIWLLQWEVENYMKGLQIKI